MDIQQIQELFLKMQKLQSKWAEKYPSRARGGRAAIAGFRYQFFSFLCSLVQEWISYDTTERNNIEMFLSDMETLSDIITITKSGIIIATQSKITLRSSSLNDALNEFVTIQETLQNEFPSETINIKYQVLCSKIEIKDINQALSTWKTKYMATNNGLEFLNSIEIISEASPENRLLGLLANNFKCLEPVTLIHKWLGLIIDCIKSVDTMNFAGRTIWEDLFTLWRNSNNMNNGLYIWQDTDFPPEEVSNGSVLTGQRPNISHLKNGFFSRRTNAYDDLEENFFTMINSLHYTSNGKVPIFWIGGRSGSGKSVAILHLLANLNNKGFGPIIWIGHQTSLLCSAVKFAIESAEFGHMTIIGLDDPYVVGIEHNVSQHWDDVFALLHSYQQTGKIYKLPIFVACGPTEQAYLFKDDYCEYLEFDIKELARESNKEKEELRDWYHKRTGNMPPDVDDSNTLMVQLFFQWDRHQSIQEFSKRLKERLIQGDPSKTTFNLVSRILSLNRLYIGYESAAIKINLLPEQKDLLIWLENDLHLGEREMNGTNKYWLLHAHLANALYLNWFEHKPASYTEHLKEAIIDSIIFGNTPNEKTAPLWAISRVFRQTSKDELYQRLNENTVRVISKDIYLYTLEKFYEISMLPVWVEICSLKPDLGLLPSPIELAIDVLKPENTGEKGLRLLIHKLLQHYNTYNFNTQQKIKDVLVEFLIHTHSWKEWFPIVKHSIIIFKDVRIIPVIENFISRNNENTSIELLYLAIKTWPNNENLINLATKKICNVGYSFYWEEISKELIRNSKSILHENIVRWFEINKDDQHICFALRESFSKFYYSVRDISIYWLRKWHHLDYASIILEPLLVFEENNQEVIDWCYYWLLVNNNDIDKSFMIEKLLKTEKVSPKIIEIATEWLNNVDSKNPSWSFVWQALNNLHNVDIDSFDSGINWLKQNDFKHKAWPYNWIYLYKKNCNDIILLKMGIEWLNQSSIKHFLWIKILQCTSRAFPQNAELKNISKQWFDQEDISYNAWPYIWQKFYKEDPDNKNLINLAKKWLHETTISHSAWVYVWSTIIKSNADDVEIFDLGIVWLKKIEINNKQWRYTWEILIQIDNENSDLLDIAEKWLKGVDYKTSGWDHVWKKLYKSDLPDKNSILELGLVWLTKVDQFHGGWTPIWDSVFKADLSNISLYNMGLNYLRNINWNTGLWCNAWLLLVKARPEDEYLYIYGFKWLSTMNRNSAWQYIWIKMFDLDPKNAEVINIGIRWLDLEINITGAWAEVYNRVICSSTYAYSAKLLNQGAKWLEKIPLNHGCWGKTWLNFMKIKPGNTKLLELGYSWMKNSSKNATIWAEVWYLLLSYYDNDNFLLNEGLEWLMLDLREHDCWEKIYRILDNKTAC